jgi:hypothetical protein
MAPPRATVDMRNDSAMWDQSESMLSMMSNPT